MTPAYEQTPDFPAFYCNFCIFRTATISQGKMHSGVIVGYLNGYLSGLAGITLRSTASNNTWHGKKMFENRKYCFEICSVEICISN